MLTTVDKHGEFIIQKVTTPRGKLVGYQAGIPGDGSTFKRAMTLAAIREAVGREIIPPVTVTLPKTAYVQCTAGYRATAPGKKR